MKIENLSKLREDINKLRDNAVLCYNDLNELSIARAQYELNHVTSLLDILGKMKQVCLGAREFYLSSREQILSSLEIL